MFLFKEQKNKYKIMSRSTCEKYCRENHSKTSIIISIKSSWDRVVPDVFTSKKNNVKHILFLSFDDCEMEDSPNHCMQFEDGEKIAKFINKYYDKVEIIIFHCDGGISRSAGVCAGVMRVKEKDDYPVFDNRSKHPNMTCYLRTLKGFGYI